MNLSLVQKSQPPVTGRTLLDLRGVDLPMPKDIQAPTQAEIDKFAFALAELRLAKKIGDAQP